MPLFGGCWYHRWPHPPPPSCATTGLTVSPLTLERLAASAIGAPVTWDHGALGAILASPPGGERAAAAAHRMNIGSVVAAWVDSTGAARAVFDVDGAAASALVSSKVVAHLSATHVVGTTSFVELAITKTPARPGCNIDGRVSSVMEYIRLHPPTVNILQP